MTIDVRKVTTKAEFETFLRLPWTLYKNDPNWVPPLLSMQRHKLDREHSASWQHMEGDYFVAWRDGQPVGTIAALINHRHNEYHNERIGFFGAFECINDQATATALLEAATEWVRERGYDAIRGPVNFSSNDEYGLVIDGFDGLPVVLYPYNPPYYQTLIENVPGFEKAMDLFAYKLTSDGTSDTGRLDKLRRVTLRNNEKRGIVIRTVNTRRMRQDLTILKEIYNRAWDKNWGFVPFSERELDELVADLGSYLEPSTTLFAEVKGEPVGFLLAIPDLNQAIHAAYPRPGKPDLLAKLQVFWHWKIRSKINRVRIPLMGVIETHRGIGVEAAMFMDLYHRAIATGSKWAYGDGGWVLETNDDMIRLCEAHQGTAYRRFRVYQRPC